MSARCRLRAGDASKYIRHAADEICPGDDVLLACRVSGREQNRQRNLAAAVSDLRQQAARLGANVCGTETHVGPGTSPIWLARAAALAKARGAKILAESTDRLIRHPGYHSAEWNDAQARECDLAEMAYYTDGVVVATLLHPNATPAEVRAYQRKRGQRAKAARGGRPAKRPGYKKQRREELMPRVKQMVAEGASINRIAVELKIPRRTARRWERSFLANAELLKGD
jgi:hypothetical protein